MSLIQIGSSTSPSTVDVRALAPRDRHPLIFATFQRLAPGESFLLLNDHDPKPLYYQFQAEQPGKVGWTYLEEGPEVWKVRVSRLYDLAATPITLLTAEYPRLKLTLDEFGLDTCCGGHMTVAEAAAEQSLELDPILEALRRAL